MNKYCNLSDCRLNNYHGERERERERGGCAIAWYMQRQASIPKVKFARWLVAATSFDLNFWKPWHDRLSEVPNWLSSNLPSPLMIKGIHLNKHRFFITNFFPLGTSAGPQLRPYVSQEGPLEGSPRRNLAHQAAKG